MHQAPISGLIPREASNKGFLKNRNITHDSK